MGLDASAAKWVDKLLHVTPIYGWGWSGNAEQPQPPAEFRIRLLGLTEFRGEIAGGVARIEQPGHAYDGWQAVFSVRHQGDYNFTDRPAHYNIIIKPPPTDTTTETPAAPTPQSGACGFAALAEEAK